jgi:hypothetical protein
MEVGIGLPTTIPGVTGEPVLEWARRAEARGFSSLGTPSDPDPGQVDLLADAVFHSA